MDAGDVAPVFDGGSILSAIKARFVRHPDRPLAVWRSDTRGRVVWTVRQLCAKARTFADLLRADPTLRPGDLVYLHLENSLEYLAIWVACNALGVVPTLIHTRWRAAQIEKILAEAPPRHIFVGAEQLTLYPPEWRSRTSLVGDGGHDGGEELARFVDGFDHPSWSVCAMLFSSGTSKGSPRAIRWEHAAAFGAARNTANHLRLTPDDVCLVLTPLYHALALSFMFFSAVVSGGCVVLIDRFDAEKFWPLSIQERVSWTAPLDFEFNPIYRGACPAHSYRFWLDSFVQTSLEERFALKSVGVWGMTETVGPLIISDPILPAPDRSIGRMVDAFEYRLQADHGTPDPRRGRLSIRPRASSMRLGKYVHGARADSPEESNPWFDTGDYMEVDAGGFFYFRGRDVDRIRVGAENVSALEIEQTVLQNLEDGLVDEVAVVGKNNKFLGQVPVMFVRSLSGDRRAIAQRLKTIFAEKLADFQVPVEVHFVDRFEKVSIGKIAKGPLLALVNAAEAPRGQVVR